MTLNVRTSLTLVIGLMLVAALTASLASAQAARGGQGIMPERQKMMAEMQASQKKLNDLVAAMNAAKGGDKIDRVAAAVTELVAQHQQMHMQMMPMMGGMMQQSPAPAPAQPPAAGAEDDSQHHPKP
jgi:hypothetical protein